MQGMVLLFFFELIPSLLGLFSTRESLEGVQQEAAQVLELPSND